MRHDKYTRVYTCTNLSEHLDRVSHDVISNFLKRSRITPKQVWERVKDLLINSEESCLIIDESVQNKQYSKSIEWVKRQRSGRRLGARDWHRGGIMVGFFFQSMMSKHRSSCGILALSLVGYVVNTIP